MTDARELERTLQQMRELQKQHEESPEKARAFLVKVGIITPDGKLRKPYA